MGSGVVSFAGGDVWVGSGARLVGSAGRIFQAGVRAVRSGRRRSVVKVVVHARCRAAAESFRAMRRRAAPRAIAQVPFTEASRASWVHAGAS
jgi:hypothetical protein